MNLIAINARCCTFFENTIRGSLNHLDRRIASFVFVIFSCLASIGIYYKYIYKPRKIAEEELSKDIPYKEKLMLAKQAGKYVTTLSFRKAQIEKQDLKDLFNSCPNIETLYLYDCKITEKGISALSKDLKNLFLTDVEVEDAAMSKLPEKLEYLNLRIINTNHKLTNAAFLNLPKNLTELHINIEGLTQDALSKLPENLIKLSISQASLCRLIPLPKNLKEIQFFFCEIQPEFLKNLSPSLETLKIQCNKSLQEDGLNDLPLSLTSLEFWECEELTEQGIAKLKRLNNLKRLVLTGSKKITDSIIHCLPPNLEFLYINHCDLKVQPYTHLKSRNKTLVKREKSHIQKLIHGKI